MHSADDESRVLPKPTTRVYRHPEVERVVVNLCHDQSVLSDALDISSPRCSVHKADLVRSLRWKSTQN